MVSGSEYFLVAVVRNSTFLFINELFLCVSFLFLFTAVHHGEFMGLCGQLKHLICQDTEFSVSSTRKETDQFMHERTTFCPLGVDCAATSALKSDEVVCDACFKQRDYLPFVCVCIIYHLPLLRTNVSHHFSVVEMGGSHS